jgi:hypothetical protein
MRLLLVLATAEPRRWLSSPEEVEEVPERRHDAAKRISGREDLNLAFKDERRTHVPPW